MKKWINWLECNELAWVMTVCHFPVIFPVIVSVIFNCQTHSPTHAQILQWLSISSVKYSIPMHYDSSICIKVLWCQTDLHFHIINAKNVTDVNSFNPKARDFFFFFLLFPLKMKMKKYLTWIINILFNYPPLSGVTTCRVQTLISLSQRMFRIHKCFWLNLLAELCYHFNFPQSLVDCFSSLSCLLIHRKHIFLQQVTKSESKHYIFTRANLNFMVW